MGATCCTRRDYEKELGHRVQALFWRFLSFARGQYHRTAPTRKIRNLSHFLKVFQRVEIYNFAFSTRRRRPLAAPTKLYNLLQNRRGEHCSPVVMYIIYDIIIKE